MKRTECRTELIHPSDDGTSEQMKLFIAIYLDEDVACCYGNICVDAKEIVRAVTARDEGQLGKPDAEQLGPMQSRHGKTVW